MEEQLTNFESEKEVPDEELMKAFKLGDVAAFNMLYERYSGMLLGYIRKRVSNDEICREIFQDTFLKLSASRSRYKDGHPFAPWFFCIARNALIDSLRKSNVEKQMLQELAVAENSTYHQMTNSSFDELIRSLTAREQKILSMKFKEDLTFEKISQYLGITSSNVRKIASRALKLLRGSGV